PDGRTRCWCNTAAATSRSGSSRPDGQLTVHIAGWPRFGATKGLNVDAVLRVPRNLPLRSDLRIGKMTIEGIASEVTAHLTIGEVHVTLPKEAIGSAALNTGIGEAQLLAAGRRYSSEGLFTR